MKGNRAATGLSLFLCVPGVSGGLSRGWLSRRKCAPGDPLFGSVAVYRGKSKFCAKKSLADGGHRENGGITGFY